MTTWVLLRGLTRSSAHFGDFGEGFASRVGAARVLSIELPGNGTLCQERSPTHIVDFVDHCRASVRRAGERGPVHLLAMSLGAMVAAAWAQQHPTEIAAGVLINTSLRPWCPLHWRLRPARYPTLLRLALAGGSPLRRERAIFQITTRLRSAEAATIVAHWAALREARPVHPANAVRQVIAALRYRAPARAPGVPLLLLASAADALVDPRCSHRIARQWAVPCREHPTAGHDLPLDDPQWVADQVACWLADLPARAA